MTLPFPVSPSSSLRPVSTHDETQSSSKTDGSCEASSRDARHGSGDEGELEGNVERLGKRGGERHDWS